MTISTSTGVPISAEIVHNYFHTLINKLFKILPLYECKENSLCEYMRNLQIELIGCKGFIVELENDPRYISMLSILEHLIGLHSYCGFTIDHHIVKKSVFQAISICEELEERYERMVLAAEEVQNEHLG